MKTIASIITAIALFASAPFAVAGPYRSVVIKGSDPTYILEVPARKAFIITTFSQDVGGLSGARSLTVTINGKTTTILTAVIGTAGELTKDVVIAGPATIQVVPDAGTDLFLSYKIVGN